MGDLVKGWPFLLRLNKVRAGLFIIEWFFFGFIVKSGILKNAAFQ